MELVREMEVAAVTDLHARHREAAAEGGKVLAAAEAEHERALAAQVLPSRASSSRCWH
jgi:hypothetical protein